MLNICNYGILFRHLQIEILIDKHIIIFYYIDNQIKKVITSVKIKHTKNLRYRIYAVKQVNTGSEEAPVYAFYPPMLPSGHIRFSGPQRGIVKKTLDPMLNGRCRVQTFGTELSPWLRVSREMVNISRSVFSAA